MKKATKEKILEIINENMENESITLDRFNDDLSELGMDSICFIQIIVGLEEAFDCEIPDSKLLITEMNTIQKMFDVLQELYEALML